MYQVAAIRVGGRDKGVAAPSHIAGDGGPLLCIVGAGSVHPAGAIDALQEVDH